MAEAFEVVRTIHQHLRRGAALREAGNLDEALAEANAALALDAENLPAQALRDRIARTMRTPASLDVAASPVKPSSYVPHGVNAASWHGFEQRITERRFRALLETVNTSIVNGDAAAARLALEEARELRPDATELAALESRAAALPVTSTAAPPPTARVWMRAMGAAALFLVGVSMFIGLELMRPPQGTASVPVATPVEVPAPPDDIRFADIPRAEPLPEPIDEDDGSVPAIIMPPEPTLRPRGTNGAAPTSPPVAEPVARRENAPPPATAAEGPLQTVRIVDDPPAGPVAEVPDDYVTGTPDARPASNENAGVAPRAVEVARSEDVTRVPLPQPRAPEETEPLMPSSSTETAAAVVPSPVTLPPDTIRVEEVLRRYARAYGSLDAGAARAVWPSVNEKALASAFQDLSSQNVSFDNCDIDVRGAVANASCSGQQSYVVKVGDRAPRTEPRLWRFELRRDGDEWMIENAEMRRPASSASSYRDR
jgi:hypothetical protein